MVIQLPYCVILAQLLEASGSAAHREAKVLREAVEFRCPRRSFPGSWFTRTWPGPQGNVHPNPLSQTTLTI
jgi:hypothetical protein